MIALGVLGASVAIAAAGLIAVAWMLETMEADA